MSRFTRFILSTTTALSVIAIAAPAHAKWGDNPYSEVMFGHPAHIILDTLVADYQRDPGTFEDALEYLSLNHPEILDSYLERTRAAKTRRNRDLIKETKAGSPYNPSTETGTSVSAASVGLGIAGIAGAAYLISQGGDDSGGSGGTGPIPGPDPVFNFTPIEGDEDSFQTSEYNDNYSMDMIGAASRYASGAQGQGVKISILDTGITANHGDFAGKIDLANSYSYFGDPNDISDTGGHGSHVAGTAAAMKNDTGMHGVAFGSELVIFKGIPGNDSETSSENVWAESLNRSVNARAHVMNNSWNFVTRDTQTSEQRTIIVTDFSNRSDFVSFMGGFSFESALANAKANDLMSVVAAGNSGLDEVGANAAVPLFMPEYDGYFIAAVALDADKSIADYSNRCGAAKDFCLAAPGTNIRSVAHNHGDGVRRTLSGTSMAAPHITGAYALLKSASPELTAPEISQILFDTAEDLGAPGVDNIYGQGLIDISTAMAPVGQLVVYDTNTTLGSKTPLDKTRISASPALSAAMSSALAGQNVMVGDRYNRGFQMEASAMLATSSAALPSFSSANEIKLSNNLTMLSGSSGTGFKYEGERFGYTLSQGSLETDNTDPLSLFQSDYQGAYKFLLGQDLSITTEFSGASNLNDYRSASLGIDAGLEQGSGLSASLGMVNESGTVLGSQFHGAAGDAGSSKTSYIEMTGRIGLSSDSFLSISGTRSETNFSQKGLITGGRDLAGTSGKIAFSKKNAFGTSGTFIASLSSPLQVTSGKISMDLPQSRAAAQNGVVSTGVERASQTIDINSGSRPYDMTLSYVANTTRSGAAIMLNAGYRAHGPASQPFFGFSLSKSF